MIECIAKEPPAELRARAARYRHIAWDFAADLRRSILEAAAELEAKAAELEADRS